LNGIAFERRRDYSVPSLNVGIVHLEAAVATPALLALMQQKVDTYLCPSDVAPLLNVGRTFPFSANNSTNPLATSNYIGVNRSRGSSINDHIRRGGIFFENKGVKFRDILDGTSSTLMLGERRWQYNNVAGGISLARAGVVFGINARNYGNRGRNAQVGDCGPKINYTMDTNLPRARRGFSSMHPGGTQFALADGSVRFISETIDADVGANQYATTNATDSTYERLCAKADGNPVGDF
jgi:prepilin-type processing-associated H-X9-DG protein